MSSILSRHVCNSSLLPKCLRGTSLLKTLWREEKLHMRFPPFSENFPPFSSILKLSSANSLSLEEFRNLLFGKGLTCCLQDLVLSIQKSLKIFPPVKNLMVFNSLEHNPDPIKDRNHYLS